MCCEGFTSPLSDVKIGVPQGSVLGPMLFLIYINDLANCSNFDTTLYADDCVLTISHKNTLTIYLKVLCIFVGYRQLVSSYSKDVLFLLCQVTSKAMPNSKTKSNATEIQTLRPLSHERHESYDFNFCHAILSATAFHTSGSSRTTLFQNGGGRSGCCVSAGRITKERTRKKAELLDSSTAPKPK